MHKACLVTEHDEASTTRAPASTYAEVGVVGAWVGRVRVAWPGGRGSGEGNALPPGLAWRRGDGDKGFDVRGPEESGGAGGGFRNQLDFSASTLEEEEEEEEGGKEEEGGGC